MMDSNIIGEENEQIKVREIIQEKSISKSRHSLMKFMKRSVGS